MIDISEVEIHSDNATETCRPYKSVSLYTHKYTIQIT